MFERQTPMSPEKPYYYCNGTGNIKCCTESVNEIQCCGQVLSNAYDVGECGVQCGNSGLIADPISGRISKVCMGPLLSASVSKPDIHLKQSPAGVAPSVPERKANHNPLGQHQ